MIELFFWACAITAMIVSGALAIAFAGMAKDEKDIQEQEFCITAASTCGFLFFISVMVTVVFCL